MKYDNESKKSPELEQAIREITDLLCPPRPQDHARGFQPDAGENITEKVGRILSKPSI